MLITMLSSPHHPPRHETDLWQNQDTLSSCQNDKIKRYWVENTGLPRAKLSGKQHSIPSSFGVRKANVPTFLPSPYIRGNFKSSSSMVLYALWGEDKQHLWSLYSISDPVPWNKQLWFQKWGKKSLFFLGTLSLNQDVNFFSCRTISCK